MAQEKDDVAQQLDALPRKSKAELKALWREMFGQPHPAYAHKDFLVRALAYRIQENAYGGLDPKVRRRLLLIAEKLESGKAVTAPLRIKPGTRLVREWSGDTHVVTVLEEGFEYRSKRYSSLSEIARAITGTRWSGPAFFGLKSPQTPVGREKRA